jgi:hypothetical protein
MLCQAFAVGSAAFVGRRGVERRATVRISVVGMTGTRCGFVIDFVGLSPCACSIRSFYE